jgi:hypothetical protein
VLSLKKARGRPVTTGNGTLVGVRLQPSELAALDGWIAKQGAPMTRPEELVALHSDYDSLEVAG